MKIQGKTTIDMEYVMLTHIQTIGKSNNLWVDKKGLKPKSENLDKHFLPWSNSTNNKESSQNKLPTNFSQLK